jgi:hypothetical protein
MLISCCSYQIILFVRKNQFAPLTWLLIQKIHLNQSTNFMSVIINYCGSQSQYPTKNNFFFNKIPMRLYFETIMKIKFPPYHRRTAAPRSPKSLGQSNFAWHQI